MIPSVLLVIVFASSLAVSSSYDVILESHASTPILSSQNGGRGCLAFNPSYLTATPQNPEGLFVRRCCGMTCAGHGLKSTSKTSSEHAERIGFAACNITSNEDLQCDEVDADFNLDPFADTEDPRVFYVKETGYFYNFYYRYPFLPDQNCTDDQCTVQLSRSKTPLNASSWEYIVTLPWHRNGCCLSRPKGEKTVCIFGEGPGPFPGLGIATTTNIDSGIFETATWSSDDNSTIPISSDGAWLLPLGDEREEIKLEGGTHLHPLSDGNIITFYAAATPGWVANGNYTAGWLILSGKDPTHVLQRSTKHILIPTFEYETLCDGKSDCPYIGERNNVIFLSSAVPIGNDRFRLFFGAGDGNVGTAVVSVDVTD
eukprot:g4732.t1